MADTIERTIYKLELDDSGYIAGVDRLSNSTKKLTTEQERANKALAENEAALKKQAELVEKNRKALEDFTGSDTKARRQLEANLRSAQDGHTKLAELVANVRKGYETANKAANDFVNTTLRANELQKQTTGGKIQIAPQVGAIQPFIDQVLNQPQEDFDLKEAIAFGKTAQEFNALRTVIGAAGKEMKGFDEIVEKGKEALGLYDKIVNETGGSTLSLRTQLTQAKNELVKLEQAGKTGSAQYIELEKNVTKLTKAYNTQQDRIRVLASDTRALDFGKSAVQSATSAFQIYTAVSILAGGQNEKLQKQTLQLFAAMQLLTSLEQLSITVKRGGVLATNAQAASQAVYTAVVGASTGALRAFRLALLGTGIGAIIVGIGFLVNKLSQLKKESSEAAENQKILNEINKEAVKTFAAQVVHLDQIRKKLTDLTIPQSKRIALAKEYNKAADEGNKIDLKSIDNIDLLNAAIDRQIIKIKERAFAKAAENIVTQKAEVLFIAELTARERAQTTPVGTIEQVLPSGQGLEVGQVIPVFNAKTGKMENRALTKKDIEGLRKSAADEREKDRISRSVQTDKDVIAAKKDLDKVAKIAAPFLTAEGLTGAPEKEKVTAATSLIQNEFTRKKAELDARLAELTRKEAEDESKIRIEFAARLAKEQLEIEKLLKEKKITKPERDILSAETIQINTVEMDKALADFRKKVLDAKEKLNDEILDLQNKNTQDQLNLIQDEFDRRKQLIDFNEERELADAKEATEDRLAALEFDRLLIGEEAYQEAKEDIISAGELAALNIIREAAQDRQDLGADTFSASLDALNQLFEDQLLKLDEVTAGKIQAEKALFLQGTINYEEFQKRITRILRDEKTERDRLRLLELNAELSAIRIRLEAVTDAEEKARLIKRQTTVRQQIADLNSETNDIVDPTKPIETVQQYAEAIGQLIDSTIAFWQKANEAEAAALDRSIALQEQRVSAAQRIAERGNASYLKAEEDRLKELQVIRENAARRDLAINAALQASQLLVGITGAIAKIATPGIGIAETIGAIAVIFAALATGYGLVKSLQGQQPRLYKGTKYLKRDGQPSGIDTIPVWANEGEAWIPTDKNKAYHPTVAAIYDGTVPAEHLNEFVKTYHQVKGVPQVNHQRIKDTAEMSIGQNGRLSLLLSEQNRLITENNDLQRQTLRVFRTNKVNVSLDKNGFAVAQIEAIEQMKKDKKT